MVPREMKKPFFRLRRAARMEAYVDPAWKWEEKWIPDLNIRANRIIRRLAREVSHRILGEFIG